MFCYAGGMKTHQLPYSAPSPAHDPPALVVYAGPAWQRDPQVYQYLATRLPHTKIWCLDGGGRFNLVVLRRIMRQLGPHDQGIWQNLQLRRAASCLDLSRMLNPAEALPGLIFLQDPLALFETGAIKLATRTDLLAQLLEQIEELLLTNPVLVSTSRSMSQESGQAEWLLHLLDLASVRVLFDRAPLPVLGQRSPGAGS